MRSRTLSIGSATLCATLTLVVITSYDVGVALSWPDDGAPVGTGAGDQYLTNEGGPTLCTDGSGGAIVAYRNGTSELRINRLSGIDGSRQWNGAAGLLVSSTASSPPHVTSDGRGGAWVAWYDTRTSPPGAGLYVQHLAVYGSVLYPLDGIRVTGGANTDPSGNRIAVATTDAGHLLVSWQGTGSSEGVWVQRILLTGVFDAFTKVSTDADVERIRVAADGEGSLVVWSGARDGDQGIWATRVTSAGTLTWGSQGRQVMNRGFGPSVKGHTIAWNGESLFVTWSYQPTASSGLRDVYAQRLNGAGSVLWGSVNLGQAVLRAPFVPGWTSSPQQDTEPHVVPDGASGCIIVWRDERDFFRPITSGGTHNVDLYGQRLNLNGIEQWNTNGLAIDAQAGTQTDARVVVNDAGSATVVYMSYFGQSRDIWARSLAPGGGVDWTRQPAETIGEQRSPMVAANGQGGFVVAWEDDRDGDVDVFATHFDGDGNTFVPVLDLTAPIGGDILYPGQSLEIRWSSNLTGPITIRYERDGSGAVDITEVDASEGQFTWTVPNLPSSSVSVSIEDVSGQLFRTTTASMIICSRYFGAGSTTPGFGGARDVVAADFNEDGQMDVAVAVDAGVAVAIGRGAGSFDEPLILSLPSSAWGIVTRDFDEDGILDLAATYGTGVAIFQGRGTGTTGNGEFNAPTHHRTGDGPRGIESADVNDDGVLDLVVANSASNTVSVFLGRGGDGVGTGDFTESVPYLSSAGPTRLVVADLDGDRILDIAVTCEDAETFDVFLGNGPNGVADGTFVLYGRSQTTNQPRGIAAADFDADGDIDLAIGNTDPTISVFLGVGDGSFAPPSVIDGESGNRDLVVGEFTGDGRADLVAAAGDFNQMTLYRGTGVGTQGDGGFEFIDTFATGSVPEAVAVEDFDADGRPDLVSANRGTGNILTVLAGPADCQFVSSGIEIRWPNGGERWALGSVRTIEWSAGDASVIFDIEVSRDLGVTWETVAAGVDGPRWDWLVTPPLSEKVFVRVSDATVATRSDRSDATFELVEATGTAQRARPHALAALHAPRPNPFNPRTTLRFDLPREGRASLVIFNAAGRRVRTILAPRTMPAGTHTFTWDGRDDSGRTVGSGIYLVRFVTDEFSTTRRAVLLK